MSSLITLGTSSAPGEVVIISSVTGTNQSIPTSCPPYCEVSGNWSGSTLKSAAPGLDGTRGGSRFERQTNGVFSVTPTLAGVNGAYYVETTHGSAGTISPDIFVSITNSGASGLPSITDGFQQLNGVNSWYRIGTMVLDGTTNAPTITFAYAGGTIGGTNGVSGRFYADGFRFINTNTLCLAGLPQLTTVLGPLAAGQTFVNVPVVDAAATNVTIYGYDGATYTFLGELTSGIVAGVNTVPTSPLVQGQQIIATQWRDGIESCRSSTGPPVGGGPNPRIRVSLSIRDNNPTNHTIGANGGTSGSHLVFIKATGTVAGGFGVAPTGGQVLQPSAGWQTVTFNSATDPLFGWTGNYGDSYLTNGYGTIDGIAFAIDDLADTGPFAIYVDNLRNGENLIQDFESATNGETAVLISRPGTSGSTSSYLLSPPPGGITPNISMVVNTNAASGTNSLLLSWQFKDLSAQDWLRATFEGAETPNPIVDLTQPISIDLLLAPVPATIVSQPQGRIALEGTTVTFSVAAIGTRPVTYQWQKDGFDLPGATNNMLTLPGVQAGDDGDYTVVVSNFVQTVTSATANLAVVSAPESRNMAVGGRVTFLVTATGTGPFTYQWNFNSTPISGATGSSLVLTDLQVTNAGVYSVTVADAAGSVSPSATLTVTAGNLVLYETNLVVLREGVGSSRVDLQACKLEYSIVSPK